MGWSPGSFNVFRTKCSTAASSSSLPFAEPGGLANISVHASECRPHRFGPIGTTPQCRNRPVSSSRLHTRFTIASSCAMNGEKSACTCRLTHSSNVGVPTISTPSAGPIVFPPSAAIR